LRDAGDDVAVAVVWIDMLPSDSEASARRAAVLLQDPRVNQFHDPQRHAGQAWAEVLGIQGIAWDTYMLFAGGALWDGGAPMPDEWFHQLGDDRADPARRRTASALAHALYEAALAVEWPAAPQAPNEAEWFLARDAALAQVAAGMPGADERCAACRAASKVTSCSLAGWRRLLLRTEGTGRFSASPVERPSTPDGRRQVDLAITGMECSECMLRAGSAVLSLKGVEEVEVLLDDGELHALVASWATATDDDVAAAVQGQGFQVQEISKSPARRD
jgi:copper chaperone CopZ